MALPRYSAPIWRWSVKRLIKSKLARRIMRGKSKSQVPQPKGAKDLARAIFAVADKKLETKQAGKGKRNSKK